MRKLKWFFYGIFILFFVSCNYDNIEESIFNKADNPGIVDVQTRGSQSVVEMIPYRSGVITAFSSKGIYYSPDGRNVGGGGSTISVY